MSPGQLCNDLLHKLLVGVRFGKSPHIFQVSCSESGYLGKCFDPLQLSSCQISRGDFHTFDGAIRPAMPQSDRHGWLSSPAQAPQPMPSATVETMPTPGSPDPSVALR